MGTKASKLSNSPATKRRSQSFSETYQPSYDIVKVVGRRSEQTQGSSSPIYDEPMNEHSDVSFQKEIRPHATRSIHSMPRLSTSTSGRSSLTKANNNSKAQASSTLPLAWQKAPLPSILYYLDETSHVLCILDPKTGRWKKNELKLARCSHPHFSLSSFGAIVFRNEILSHLEKSALVPVDDDTIHIVGRYHLEYQVSKNNFKLLGERPIKFSNPTVCYGNSKIYFLSGEKDRKYVTTCAVYDCETNSWSSLPDLPAPHVNGSACCYQDPLKPNSFKLIVIGGYSSNNINNQQVSVFDFDTYAWETFALPDSGSPLPKINKPPLFQDDNGALLVLDSDGIFYDLDVNKKRFKKAEGIYAVRDFSSKAVVSYCRTENNQLAMLTKSVQKSIRIRLCLDEDISAITPTKKPSSEYQETKVNLTRQKTQNLIMYSFP
mgnify:FL=1